MIVYVRPSRYMTAAKREEVYKASFVFLNELLDDEDDDIIIDISVRGDGLTKDVDGYCLCVDEFDNGKPSEISIEVRGDKGLDHLIKSLAHETVHAWQMITNRMDPSKYKGDYWNAPWEIEARELEEPLYELYLENS